MTGRRRRPARRLTSAGPQLAKHVGRAGPASALLTTSEVADFLRVHPKHVYRLLKKGLPARRVGAEWRFDRDDVLVWSGGKAPERRADAPVALGMPPPALIAGNGDVALMTLLRLSSSALLGT